MSDALIVIGRLGSADCLKKGGMTAAPYHLPMVVPPLSLSLSTVRNHDDPKGMSSNLCGLGLCVLSLREVLYFTLTCFSK